MTFPLEGIRVLDLSQAVSGPFACRMLSDLGADVVRVEWPRGDVSNAFGRKVGGVTGLFTQMNAGKRGISGDLSSPAGVALIARLANRADVVIENFRPGVLDRAGLGYETLSEHNQRLIMLSISGFGAKGPESQRQAYAPVIHAESGLLARQATYDERPPVDITLALADSLASLHGTVAVLAALTLRGRTGTGQHIDLSMLDAMIATDDYVHYAADGVHDYALQRGELWDATGGPVMIAGDAKLIWARVATSAGLIDPAPNAELATKIAGRRAAVADWIASFSNRDELIAALVAANLPWADLRSSRTILDSPSVIAREVFESVDDGEGGERRVVRMPYRFSDAECAVAGPAPTRGRDNDAVLGDWLDLSPDEVAALVSSGAV